MERATAPSRLLLPVLFVAVFMVILDVFIVVVAAPSMSAELHASASEIQWVVAAYLLAYAMTLITGARLGDIVGRRRMLRVGLVLFSAASALCAAAPTPTALIVARVVQGLGSAAMWPQVLSIVQVEFAPAERPRAFALLGVVQGAAAIAGQVVGGGLIALDLLGLGWRWVFLVNVPVGLAALAAAGRVVPESRSANARRLDVVGVVLATATLGLVMFPIVEGRDLGWPWWTGALLVAALPAAAVFLAWERRVVATGRSPLLDLRLFAQRGLRMGVAAAIVLYGVLSFFLWLGLYLQDGGGLTPIQSGVAFTPLAAAYVAASLLGSSRRSGADGRAAGRGRGRRRGRDGDDDRCARGLRRGIRPRADGRRGDPGRHRPGALDPAAHEPRPAHRCDGGRGRGVGDARDGAAGGQRARRRDRRGVFFGRLGARTGAVAYGDAFAAAAAVQAALALVAAALVARARARAAVSGLRRAGEPAGTRTPA
jgi:MFS family permease